MSEFTENLRALPRFASTYAVGAASIIGAWWMSLTLQQQQDALTAWPWLWWGAPLAGFVTFAATRAWPQFPDSPTFAEALRAMPGYMSAWVAAAASIGAGYWLQMPPAQQMALLMPGTALGTMAPLATLVPFFIARALPGKPAP